jgi:hypothetical protein
MTVDERRAAIRERKREGAFLTDEELRSYTGWTWSLRDRQTVREALSGIPHDTDCNWLPAGGVYAAVHRDGEVIFGVHSGYFNVSADALDVVEWFTERLGQPYVPRDSQAFLAFTMPDGKGPTSGGSKTPSRAVATAMCPRCSTYPLTATGKCMGGCDD